MQHHQRQVLLLERHCAQLGVGQEHVRGGGEQQDAGQGAQRHFLRPATVK